MALAGMCKAKSNRLCSIIGNMQRGVLFLIASALFIHAMSKAPLAQVFAVSYMAPVLAALLAMPILGERPDGRVALSLAFGFAGVVVAIGGVDLSGASFSSIEGSEQLRRTQEEK